MNESVKIAEDLQEMYAQFLNPHRCGLASDGLTVCNLIERVSAAEAELALAKEGNARHKAPVSDAEINAFTKVIAVPSWMRGAFIDCLNAMIRARSKTPDGAQEAEGK